MTDQICILDNIETNGAEDGYLLLVKCVVYVVHNRSWLERTMSCRGSEPPRQHAPHVRVQISALGLFWVERQHSGEADLWSGFRSAWPMQRTRNWLIHRSMRNRILPMSTALIAISQPYNIACG